jgi:hypothetical protein
MKGFSIAPKPVNFKNPVGYWSARFFIWQSNGKNIAQKEGAILWLYRKEKSKYNKFLFFYS